MEADNESCRLRRMQTRFSSALVPVGSSRRALQRMVKSPIVAALQSPTDAERSCWPRPARIAWPPPVERPMTARRSRWERVRNVAVAFARPFFRRGLDSARCKEAPAHGRRRIRGGVAGRGPVVRSRGWVAPGGCSKDGDSWSSDAEPRSCEPRAGPFGGRRALAGNRKASQREISKGLRRYFGLVGILNRLNDQNSLLGFLTRAGPCK